MDTSIRSWKGDPEQLREFLHFVRENSAYFRDRWSHVAPDAQLECYPSMDHEEYWNVATSEHSDQVLTGEHLDGVVYKSGGTTAQPKVTRFTQAEEATTAVDLAKFLQRCGIRPGDRVANLLYVGSLYSSFLGVAAALQSTKLAVHLPIAGHESLGATVQHLREHQATVVVSIVTQLQSLAALLNQAAGLPLEHVRLLLYGGEALYEDQLEPIRRAFPNATMISFAYGTTEAGIIGFRAGDVDRRVHVANEPALIIEIVDDDDCPILETGLEGRLLVTNLQKRLMPVVRYPSGDRACWVSLEERIFRLGGRDQLAVRLGPVSIDLTGLRRIVQTSLELPSSPSMQVVQERACLKDRLRIRLILPAINANLAAAAISTALSRERPMYQEHVEKGIIGSLVVESCPSEDCARSERTGKVLPVVDTRQ